MHTHTQTHTHVYTRTHTLMHTHAHPCMQIHAHTHMHAHTHTHQLTMQYDLSKKETEFKLLRLENLLKLLMLPTWKLQKYNFEAAAPGWKFDTLATHQIFLGSNLLWWRHCILGPWSILPCAAVEHSGRGNKAEDSNPARPRAFYFLFRRMWLFLNF